MQDPWGFIKPTVILLLIYICTGCSVEDDPNLSSSSSSSSGSPTQACTTDLPPSTPLRRLTRFEYRNSVSDLLGVSTNAVDSLPADSSDGFDNNAILQTAPELLVEKYVLVSEALAAEAVKDLSELTQCSSAISDRACATQFAQTFGRRAFRRAISSADEAMFIAAYDAGSAGGTHAKGIEVMVRMALQSPNFIYRLETNSNSSRASTPLDSYEIATRLSYFLWGSTPSDKLLDTAAKGELSTKQQIGDMAREMLSSPKARASVTNFLSQWSSINKLNTIAKNTSLFPNYSDDVLEAMKKELPFFVNHMFATRDVTLSTLFTSNKAFVSGPLADIYDLDLPSDDTDAPFQVNLPSEQGRSGLFTQAGFLAVQAHPDQTSPVLRGKFVRTSLLCDPPPPPPDDLDISVPELSEAPTARERASLHLSAGGSCNGCHTLMDPIGLAFENFDAIGQYRETESGEQIDASGEILFAKDPSLEGGFVGVKPLASMLANSSQVQSCVADHMFRYASGRFENSEDSCSTDKIKTSFIASGGDLLELMIAMTQTDAFMYRD